MSFTLRANNAGLAPTFGAVTVTDTLPAGLSALSFGGPGWSCTLSPLQCGRSDVLSAGGSYPDLSLVVRASVGATGNVTNAASVLAPAEGSVNTGNNGASDVLTVQPKPNVTLSKTVRNVSTGGAAGTNASVRPGQTLEYCVRFQNTGGDAPGFTLQDDAPANTTALPSAYGPGLAAQLTLGSTTTLTGALDADAATLIGSRLTYTHGLLLLGQVGTVCFQATVN